MSIENILGLGTAVLSAALIVGFWILSKQSGRAPVLRQVNAFEDLPQKAGEAVESGKRIHVSLGSGGVGGQNTAVTLAGLTVLEAAAEAATISDKPPIVTAGDGTAMILAQDTLRRTYKRQNVPESYDHLSGRLAGASPLSYAAGVMTALKDESVSVNLFVGSFGNEAALMAAAGWDAGAHQIIGANNVEAQALMVAAADHALVGEDVFASGAYLSGGKTSHRASLQAQDVLRVLIVLAILGGTLLKVLGLMP